jgi:hypothetical protein
MVQTKRPVAVLKDRPPDKNGLVFLILIACITSAGIYMGFRHYEDVVKEDERGNVALREERIQDLQQQQWDIEAAYVCYKLTANTDKYYDCSTCYLRKFYLLRGEIIKYGITSKGIDRYPVSELYKEKKIFIPMDTGSLEEMRALELELIGLYPLRLENQIRPYRDEVIGKYMAGKNIKLRYKLARPPQNVRD